MNPHSVLLVIARVIVYVVAGMLIMLDGPEWHDAVIFFVGAVLIAMIAVIHTSISARRQARLLTDQQEVNRRLKPIAMELDRLYKQEIRLQQQCSPLVPLSPKYDELGSVQREIKHVKAKWNAATEAALSFRFVVAPSYKDYHCA